MNASELKRSLEPQIIKIHTLVFHCYTDGLYSVDNYGSHP